jgi:site-specific DNA-methyltransferase (cytosine-N4-specific)
MVFLLVKQRRYWFNLDAVRQPYTGDRTLSRRARKGSTKPNSIPTAWPPPTNTQVPPPEGGHSDQATVTSRWQQAASEQGRNPGDVWTVATRPYPGAHFAVQPVDIPLRCIAAGCRPGGVVLDPFSGAGTTLIAARQLGHPAIGIDLRADYHHLALERLDLTPGPRGEPW